MANKASYYFLQFVYLEFTFVLLIELALGLLIFDKHERKTGRQGLTGYMMPIYCEEGAARNLFLAQLVAI
jgi:hypothetical protein